MNLALTYNTCMHKIPIQQAVGGRPPQYAPTPCDLDLWPFALESGVRVRYGMGYLCANFSLPRPLCSWLRPDVRDRQTDIRQHHRLMPPPRGRGIINNYSLSGTDRKAPRSTNNCPNCHGNAITMILTYSSRKEDTLTDQQAASSQTNHICSYTWKIEHVIFHHSCSF